MNAKEFKGCVPATEYKVTDERYTYTYGDEQSYAKAKELLLKVQNDFKDAFIAVFKDGERLSREEARPYLK